MFRFTSRLTLRSGRMFAPFLVWLIWLVGTFSPPGDQMSNVDSLFPATLIWAIWTTIAAGNVDDSPHRDMLAAAAGSAGRLHAHRAGFVLVAGAAMAMISTGMVLLVSRQPNRRPTYVGPASVGLLVAAVALGVAIGTLIHRPLVAQIAITVVAAIVGGLGVLLVAPLQHVLQSFGRASATGVPWLLAASLVAVAISVAAASTMANYRAR